MGTTAGNGTLTGTDCLGIGLNSLNALTSGVGNVFVGANCGKFLQSGSSNVGMGVATLRQSVSNSFNTAIGHNAGTNLTGNSNTILGYQAGTSITSGTQNVLIGYQAGSAYTSSEGSNIILGYGVAGTAAESNVTRIGTGQTACYISGIDAVSVGTNAVLVQEASGQLGTTTTTYPRTNAINTILYASSANVMSALATANSGVLATNSSGVPSITATPTVTSVTFGSGTALNTYVQGTFTPAFAFGGSATGFTYSTQIGQYTQIGNVVYFLVALICTNKGSGTGNVTITGFPVSAGTNAGDISNMVGYFNGWTMPAGFTAGAILMGASSTTGTLIRIGSGQTPTIATTASDTLTNSLSILCTGFYFTT